MFQAKERKKMENGKGKGIGERSWLAVDVSRLRVLGLVGVVMAEGMLHAPLSERLNEKVSHASPASLLHVFLLFMPFLLLFYSSLLFLFIFSCFSLIPCFLASHCFHVFHASLFFFLLFSSLFSPCFPVPLLLPGPLLPCFPCFPAFFVFLLAFASYYRGQCLLGGLKGSV